MEHQGRQSPDAGLVDALLQLRIQNPLGIADAQRLLGPLERVQADVYAGHGDGKGLLPGLAEEVYAPSILEAATKLRQPTSFVLDGFAASLGAGRVHETPEGIQYEREASRDDAVQRFVVDVVWCVQKIEQQRRLARQ